MDGSAKNRFELLCMDDDATDPIDTLVRKKVKQTTPSPGTVNLNSQTLKNQKTGTINHAGSDNLKSNIKNVKKSLTTAEKENKSAVMNKNEEKKSAVGNGINGGHRDAQSVGGRQSQNKQGIQQRNVNFKQQNGETHEQRNNRRNRDDINNPRPFANRNERNNNNNDAIGNSGLNLSNNHDGNEQRPTRRRENENRGPPRNRNFDGRSGKREFDRQSGSDKTGVKAIDKKDGAGGYNWGTPKQDIEDLNKTNTDEAITDKEETATELQKDEQTAPVEEETKELTLDEWKAQRQQRAKPQFNIRKAGEGEDLSQWKKMIALNNKTKKKCESDEDELEYDPSMYPQRVGRLQRIVDIEFHFNDGRRGGAMARGRGGRGQRNIGGGGGLIGQGNGNCGVGGADASVRTGSGGGGNGVPSNTERNGVGQRQRAPRERKDGDRLRGGQHAPKVDDERQFPTLS